MKKLLTFLLLFMISTSPTFAALPSSASYQLRGYSFGAGGGNNITSTNYGFYGVAGEIEFGQLSSASYKVGTGLTYLLQSNLPGAPTITNPGNTYDRLQIILNTSSNPTDTTYAIQLSTVSNFASNISYVKSDNTIGATLTTADYRTYTSFGGASGFFVTRLSPNTTYYFRVKARQGKYSETGWGPSSSAATINSTLTLTLSANTITFSPLNAGNSYTDSAKSTTLTTTTNAYNGYTIYGKETTSLTSPSGATIANYTSPNSAPTAWSGTGFGYTTNNTNLAGSGGANRFNNGTYYAGFGTNSGHPNDPGDIVASDAGPVQSSEIINESFIISYRITGSNTTSSGTYSNIILYTIVPSF